MINSVNTLITSTDEPRVIVEKLLSQLHEGKQVGYIYHVMDVAKFVSLLRNDALGRPTSFTRDSNYDFVVGREKNYVYQIKVDGDKLSDRYKIRPVHHGGGWVSDEAEELVEQDIRSVGKYISEIIIIRKKHFRWKSKGYNKGTYNDFFPGNYTTEISNSLLKFLSKYPHIVLKVKDGHGGRVHNATEELKWLRSMGVVNPKEAEIAKEIQGLYKDRKLVLRDLNGIRAYVQQHLNQFFVEILGEDGEPVVVRADTVKDPITLWWSIGPVLEEFVCDGNNHFVVIQQARDANNRIIIQILHSGQVDQDLQFYERLAAKAQKPVKLINVPDSVVERSTYFEDDN